MDTITAQTNYIVMTPAQPTSDSLVRKVSQAMANLDAIREAHLPAVIEFGTSNQPALTLFAVVANDGDQEPLINTLNKKINGGLFNNNTIAIKVIPPNFPLLQSIRDTNCLVGWRD